METRGKRPSRVQISIVILLVIIALAVIGLTVFQIKNALVIGNERYSSDKIVSDLVYDFPTRNSLYLGWKYRSAKAEPRAPYLSSVQVKMTTPGSVQLIVQEKTLYGCVRYDSQYVCFDQDGIVLEITDEVDSKVILVTGLSMEAPQLYKKLPVENTAQLRTMLSVTKLLRETDLPVTEISFDENQNITAMVGTIQVLLGQDEYLEEKVSNLSAIYKLQAGQSGVLNMSAYTGKNEPITFSNPETETPQTETSQEVAAGDQDVGDELAGYGAAQTAQDQSQQDAAGAQDGAGDADSAPAEDADSQVTGIAGFMVFDSSGTLRYDARVVNGQVLDAYGNPIDGCSVNENGYVVDAYMNVIDPMTGTLAE